MTSVLSEKIKVLPPMQQQELLDFAEYLVRKYGNPGTVKKKPRKAGSLKGFLLYMADDFDAPLDDFKEYMQGSASCLTRTLWFGFLRQTAACQQP